MGDLYFDACAPDDPLSIHYMHTNRADYAAWRSVMPNPVTDDVGVHSVRIACRMGVSETLARQNFDALLMLHSLPKLSRLIDEMAHIDLWRLRAIDRATIGVEHYALEAVDTAITEYLTPRYPNQHLPGAVAIRNKVRKIVLEHDPLAAERDEDESRRSLGFTPTSGGGAKILGYLPADEAHILHEALTTIARKEECTLVDALLKLVCEKVDVRVVLNVYSNADAPDYMDGAGSLSPMASERQATRVTSIRDLREGVAEQVADSYAVPAAMVAFVRGRDGTCRGPGCDVPAVNCDIDHRIPFDQGGLTTPANLHALCRKCHNRKTDGVMEVIMDAQGADHWIFPDGSVVVTLPGGPIKWPAKQMLDGRWRQNWEERTRERRGLRRQENQRAQNREHQTVA
ncbi:HNH endonuclease signature motif containing protein [uncultured Corynebacterium sp.]|uniref:HNH endonuclease signature motif containing protein n=1 Tax=uncultured Corynebacterium sp. TaxID=159447 RepID=UPI0025968B19|nr:HNH endonuclease signature motif containing protein [uncultured Corynebacterium sp.]